MKQLSAIIIFICLFFCSFSQQKVGINKTNPTETLDVNGNVNVDGNLKVNGTAGQAGQILTTNSSGATQWVDVSRYKNVITFIQQNPNYTAWSIPAGVKEVYIEMVGGGGAGTSQGGGGGGMFVSFLLEVTPTFNLFYRVGRGGTATTSTDALSSRVLYNSITYEALHGGRSGSGFEYGGSVNYWSSTINDQPFVMHYGQGGTSNKYSYTYGPNGNSIRNIDYGSGGGVYPSYINNPGGSWIRNQTLSADLNITLPSYPSTSGSGGPGGQILSARNDGADGYIRVYY